VGGTGEDVVVMAAAEVAVDSSRVRGRKEERREEPRRRKRGLHDRCESHTPQTGAMRARSIAHGSRFTIWVTMSMWRFAHCRGTAMEAWKAA